MNTHEEKFIKSFIAKEKQGRYEFLLESDDPKRRRECTNRLNHCRDLNERYVTWLPRDPRAPARNPEIVELLRDEGAPKTAYVLACSCAADGKTLPLLEVLDKTVEAGWGTIISCIPGELAYYYDEEGERRAILIRKPGS